MLYLPNLPVSVYQICYFSHTEFIVVGYTYVIYLRYKWRYTCEVDSGGCCKDIAIQIPLLASSSHVQCYESKNNVSEQKMTDHKT